MKLRYKKSILATIVDGGPILWPKKAKERHRWLKWICREKLIQESILKQRPKRNETIAPINFFPFGSSARSVLDGDFADFEAAFDQFDREFDREGEVVVMDRDPVERFAFEDLIAGFNVGQA